MSAAIAPIVSAELRAPASVRAGSPVEFTLVLHNPAATPVTLYLRGRSPLFDVTVTHNGKVTWRRLEHDVIPAIIQAVTLAPDERKELRAAWKGTLVPGAYVVRAVVLTDEPAGIPAPPITLRVR